MMKFAIKFIVLSTTAFLMYFLDLAPSPPGQPVGVQLVSEAHAIAGVRRRAARRGVAVGYAAGESDAHAADNAAAASTTTTTQATANTTAPTTAPVYGALPEGTIEPALPDGCTTMSADNVQYYHCGENYFRAVFQGNNLVYVTTSPPNS